jgi:hypothetical protein
LKVWVFVEGKSDKLALGELWRGWERRLRLTAHQFEFIPLFGKGRFLKDIGPLGAELLVNSATDLVIGLPDLYPNTPLPTRLSGMITSRNWFSFKETALRRRLKETTAFADPISPRKCTVFSPQPSSTRWRCCSWPQKTSFGTS